MKRILALIFICITYCIVTGFDNADQLKLSDVEITIIKSDGVLRYDFKIKNTGETPIKSEFDYPGRHPLGIELVVRPNEKLATQMEMEENTKYRKMRPRGAGSSSYFQPGVETHFYVEYQVKKGADYDKVRKYALDSTLLILDGMDVSAEFPLNVMKN
ncbi:hypothetical protein CWR48_05180 [Oceanobacillus arenosus]|uniref:Uncharacterized protein n=1 Tax=Oceanobacillus arenosus TaxID=1229153 RepID=A0A3D8PXX1_9BACI|nr:hypothetical protein [Oceanobacillus arenosus]RDW20108.1 hypothetical protein CWR48_05180 [Oceanobacillus arenosus]